MAQVEYLPRAGPMGDIFLGVLIYYTEDLLPQPPSPPLSPHFFFSICLGRCEAGAGLSVSLSLFHSAVGVDSFVLKCHVFFILGPFGWKFLKRPGSAPVLCSGSDGSVQRGSVCYWRGHRELVNTQM